MVAGDQAKVSVLVRVPQAEAFRIFTEEIDGWWRAGRKYRIGKDRSVVHLEPRLGGRLFESFAAASGTEKILQTGIVTSWEPPARVVLQWRAANFRADETTEVEVRFEPTRSGTTVTVIHRGWSTIRPDHPARHGEGMSAFTRTLAAWWGDRMTSLRIRAEESLSPAACCAGAPQRSDAALAADEGRHPGDSRRRFRHEAPSHGSTMRAPRG